MPAKGNGSSSSSGPAPSLDEATIAALALELQELSAGSRRSQLYMPKVPHVGAECGDLKLLMRRASKEQVIVWGDGVRAIGAQREQGVVLPV